MLICTASALILVERVVNEYSGQLKLARRRQRIWQAIVALREVIDSIGEMKGKLPSRVSCRTDVWRFILAIMPWLLIPITSQWRALSILFIFQADFLLRLSSYLVAPNQTSFTIVKHQTLTHLMSQCLYIPVFLVIALPEINSNFFQRGIAAIVALIAAVIHNNIGPFRSPATRDKASAMPNASICQMLNVTFSVAIFIAVMGVHESIYQASISMYSAFISKISIVTFFLFIGFTNIPSFRMNQCKRFFLRVLVPTVGVLLFLIILERAYTH
jgi:hypothetical protein